MGGVNLEWPVWTILARLDCNSLFNINLITYFPSAEAQNRRIILKDLQQARSRLQRQQSDTRYECYDYAYARVCIVRLYPRTCIPISVFIIYWK